MEYFASIRARTETARGGDAAVRDVQRAVASCRETGGEEEASHTQRGSAPVGGDLDERAERASGRAHVEAVDLELGGVEIARVIETAALYRSEAPRPDGLRHRAVVVDHDTPDTGASGCEVAAQEFTDVERPVRTLGHTRRDRVSRTTRRHAEVREDMNVTVGGDFVEGVRSGVGDESFAARHQDTVGVRVGELRVEVRVRVRPDEVEVTNARAIDERRAANSAELAEISVRSLQQIGRQTRRRDPRGVPAELAIQRATRRRNRNHALRADAALARNRNQATHEAGHTVTADHVDRSGLAHARRRARRVGEAMVGAAPAGFREVELAVVTRGQAARVVQM